MRVRKAFSIYLRTLQSGKKIFYYHAYDESGNRLPGRSTGQTTKTAATAYCMELYKAGRLIPDRDPLFKEYAENWWIMDKCDYIKGQTARGFTISRTYAYVQRLNLERHILPTFGNIKINSITSGKIEKWLFSLSEEKKLSNKTANNSLSILRTMLKEALRKGIIKINPMSVIKPLKNDAKIKDILSKEEFSKLFAPGDIGKIWPNFDHYVFNLLSACTGLRLGEVQALRAENIHPNYLYVCHSWDRKYRTVKSTKTNKNRDVTLPPFLSKFLQILKAKTPEGFIFTNNGGESPIVRTAITRLLYKALGNIGITPEQRKKRNITFHSWRHFFNTMMRGKVADHQLQLLTGHSSLEMTEHYTHSKEEDYKELAAVQSSIFTIDEKAINKVLADQGAGSPGILEVVGVAHAG